MKISGFTFVRNAIKYDYPILESINSILPIVDEYVVNVGNSEDDTLDLIRSIKDHRIKVVESLWDDSLKTDGRIFGIQQDIALSNCQGEWAILLQADEVIHEDDLSAIQTSIEKYSSEPRVLGLVFRVLHFKGDYWSLDPWMYHKATRIVRNNGTLRSTVDCCDFRTSESSAMVKNGPHGRLIPARIFHYGWVKDTKILQDKICFQKSRHDGEKMLMEDIEREAAFVSQFPNYDILKDFRKTHPSVMRDRIANGQKLRPRRNRWLNWKFYSEIYKHGFKG